MYGEGVIGTVLYHKIISVSLHNHIGRLDSFSEYNLINVSHHPFRIINDIRSVTKVKHKGIRSLSTCHVIVTCSSD